MECYKIVESVPCDVGMELKKKRSTGQQVWLRSIILQYTKAQPTSQDCCENKLGAVLRVNVEITWRAKHPMQ